MKKQGFCTQCGSNWDTPDLVDCKRCKLREIKRAYLRRKKAAQDAELERKRQDRAWVVTHCYLCGTLMDEPDPKCYRCRERMKRRQKWLTHRRTTMTPQTLNNLDGVIRYIRARRNRLGQDPNTPIEGIDT